MTVYLYSHRARPDAGIFGFDVGLDFGLVSDIQVAAGFQAAIKVPQ